MSTKKTSTATSTDGAPPKPKPADANQPIGFRPDPAPNEAYTVAGVTSGRPTPEMDATLRNKARALRGMPPRDES